MSLFLIVFFSLYTGMHLYAFLRAKAAFAFGIETSVLLLGFMAVMILAPVLVRMAEKHGLETVTRNFSYIGYIWLGVIFLFCSASAVTDIYRLSVHTGGLILNKDLSFLGPSAVSSFLLPLIVSISIAAYGYFEALNIRTERIIINTPKLSKEIGRLTIVQISDVHIGLIVREERLGRILSEGKKANPDILVATGDLVDGQINNCNGLSDMIREINPKYGKFAITGNHEFIAGIRQSLEFIKNAGFTVLRGQFITGPINIAGVDDPIAGRLGENRASSEKTLLSGLSKDKFTLLLKHRPLIDKSAVGLFDLQLSGHVHKGQIFPFSLLTKFYYDFYAGFARLSDTSGLYVSRGSGTWGPPIRFFAPPEITVIELVNEK